MAVPVLTDEQRKANLAKAMEVRSQRAKMRQALAHKDILVEDALEHEFCQGMKVTYFLESLPNIGTAKAKKIMEHIGISPKRRVRGLGRKQKLALIDEVAQYVR